MLDVLERAHVVDGRREAGLGVGDLVLDALQARGALVVQHEGGRADVLEDASELAVDVADAQVEVAHRFELEAGDDLVLVRGLRLGVDVRGAHAGQDEVTRLVPASVPFGNGRVRAASK